MKLKLYQVDAFAAKVFSGNPAAVCPLEKWLPDELLQNIAMENNLSETAFYIKEGARYIIRWFTPAAEVDLCGHATLAASHVLFNHENHQGNEISFFSPRSAALDISRKNGLITLNFPTDVYQQVELTAELTTGLDTKPLEAFKGKTDYMLVFENEQQITNIKVNIPLIAKVEARGIIITAKGNSADFVSRFFGPQVGVDEDPVTGSAHTTLTPYWAKKLGKNEMTAIQLSKRKGYLNCKYLNERVEISGQAKTYMCGEIEF
jgi:PhzF family phenazine biosynthesis protein